MGAFLFDTMIEPDPIEAVQAWQEWYKRNHGEVTMESGKDVYTKADLKDTWTQRAQEHFADTLAQYQYELSGKEFYKAFYAAAYENMEAAKKEYERAKELVDMLRYHHLSDN